MKHRKQVQQIASHVLVAVVTTVVVLAITAAGAPQAPSQSKLDALQELITDRFIGESDKVLMEDAAAHAMIGALGDQWSYYIPADEFAAYQEQKENSYVGIGVTISVRQDGTGLDVLLVTPGGSAEEVGILAGDIIVGVNGQSIVGMDVSAVGNMIRGEAETTVDVTVSRGGQELTMTVIRRQIATPVAVATLLGNNIGLIRIENFNTNCAKETIAAIEELMGQGADKLIFDVRNNPGGYAHELVDVLDHLLPEGELFRTEDYTGKQAVEKSDADCLQLPMAVLVNGNSYSAAEFFAAALSEYEWAEVVGEKTTGKGYYQVTYQFSDGSAVGLSVGKYYTPKGISLAGVGITPDVLVPVDQETANAIYAQTLEPEKDPQIQAAVKKLLEGE
jgi:carboxyl-terminal processing protease